MVAEHEEPEQEEELSLTGSAEEAQAAAFREAVTGAEQPLSFSKRVPKLKLPDSASDKDVLSAVLHASEDNLYLWEPVSIPSNGVYYGWDSSVKPLVRPMTQRAERTLTTQRFSQSGVVVDMLFAECCKFPDGFQTADLLIGDRNFLIYYIRGITHGNMYEFVVSCPDENCAQSNTYQYDLHELVSTVRWANPELGREPFRVELPHLTAVTGHNFWVGLRFVRGADVQYAFNRQQKKKSATVHAATDPFQRRREQMQNRELDNTLPEYLEQTIVSVMGETSPITRREFIARLHPEDSTAISEWLRINTPGIDSRIDMRCLSCGREFKVELPITDEFFRPKKREGVREGI